MSDQQNYPKDQPTSDQHPYTKLAVFTLNFLFNCTYICLTGTVKHAMQEIALTNVLDPNPFFELAGFGSRKTFPIPYLDPEPDTCFLIENSPVTRFFYIAVVKFIVHNAKPWCSSILQLFFTWPSIGLYPARIRSRIWT